jgi:predicted short-subunit dehydrogenase-like oxidoreductase (DUF2520 family)
MGKNAEKIVFIGAGRVATELGLALKGKYNIVQVYSRTNASAKKLAGKLNCGFTDKLEKVDKNADLYIIAVKDDAIAKVAQGLGLKVKTVFHTSGGVGMEVLKGVSENIGVLYPPHTFKGNKAFPKNMPCCIEASNANVKKKLTDLAKDLSGKVYYMDSDQRAGLHLAAVFANNFSNHMFTIADELTTRAHIPFELVKHLIKETVDKLDEARPGKNQTGPANRGDVKTLKKHEQMLKDNARYLSIYKLISKSIQENK